MVVRSSRIKGFGRLLLLARELPAGRAGTLQLASAPRFSTVPSPATPPLELLDEELLEDELELEDELLDELELEEELLDVELEEELVELELEDELLELPPGPPQAAIA